MLIPRNLRRTTGGQAGNAMPLYYQLEQDLRDRILAGEFGDGGMLPIEDELGKAYGVSKITVRRAIDGLRAQRLVIKRHGVGTFVNPTAEGFQSIRLVGYLDDSLAYIKTLTYTFLAQATVVPPPAVTSALKLEKGGSAMRFELLVQDGTIPYAYSQFYFPMQVGAKIGRADIVDGVPILRIVESKTGLIINRGEQNVRAIVADESIAGHLDVSPGSPLLQATRIYYTAEGLPIEIAVAHYHPDHYNFTVELVTNPNVPVGGIR